MTLFLAAGTLTIPGVNLANPDRLSQGDFFGILNLVGGGGLRQFSIVALGIGPFISSSLVMMILQTKAFPAIYRLSQSGPQGRIKINFITYLATLVFAIVQALLITRALINPRQGFGITFSPALLKVLGPSGQKVYQYFILPMILVAGSFFSLFLSEQITNKGVGNGTSVMIFCWNCLWFNSKFQKCFSILYTFSKTNKSSFTRNN
ncbi:hypothetical protein [Mycoplasma struthionis]|uniref:hypothetical protein n=1 Tax=Mycoplasma struthionis TaxID=538220 RepID=UPI0021BD0AEE|nr:hypothetical protein [Mycoplasma struthionis]